MGLGRVWHTALWNTLTAPTACSEPEKHHHTKILCAGETLTDVTVELCLMSRRGCDVGHWAAGCRKRRHRKTEAYAQICGRFFAALSTLKIQLEQPDFGLARKRIFVKLGGSSPASRHSKDSPFRQGTDGRLPQLAVTSRPALTFWPSQVSRLTTLRHGHLSGRHVSASRSLAG